MSLLVIFNQLSQQPKDAVLLVCCNSRDTWVALMPPKAVLRRSCGARDPYVIGCRQDMSLNLSGP